jgi:homopolymeric O-antigen transport system ATP-binding protein
MKPAIHIDNLSKVFSIGPSQAGGGYRTLRETIMEAAAVPWRRLRRLFQGNRGQRREPAFHWALRDVSFDVYPGEVVGLIGRNGAGKSTLLKVLSRITEPTSGRAELRGRVLSLLEVGTGFHQELTGRENIYLNGAILGMTRREIDRKFDDIVAFSEIGPFLDTPSKRYSSGMYVRLAFAVAAHLDPEILVVDEVLAVGDSAFQKKCLDRIRDLGKSGGTVLFVSHNMGAVASLCQKAVVLDRGQLLGYGPAREQIGLYLNHLSERSSADVAARTDRGGDGRARLTCVEFRDGAGRPVESILAGEPLTIRLGYQAEGPLSSLEGHVSLCDERGANVTLLSSRVTGDLLSDVPARGYLECFIPEVPLAPGSYLLNINLEHGLDTADSILGAAQFDVEPGPFFPNGRTPSSDNGPMLTRHRWSFAPVEESVTSPHGTSVV